MVEEEMTIISSSSASLKICPKTAGSLFDFR
jgi:hypothetical protein